MLLNTQEQFLADTKTKIKQYLYRGLAESFDPTIEFLQLISAVGPINWQSPENKSRIQRAFSSLATYIGSYGLTSGDFRTYLLLGFVDILYEEFKNELFYEFVQSSYNVTPASVVGNLDTSPMLAPPQNTNFPGLDNSSKPNPPTRRNLVPSSLY